MMKSSLRILNLEDNAMDAELNQAMLSARWPHCELVRVDNREDFVAALERGDFDLILSDYSMPNFDGRSALTLAHDKRPEIPFLFMSGTIGEDTAIEALKNGATDYVLKHRPIRLIPAVDRALREVKERAELDRAEKAMRESEYKYRKLFESLTDAAFLADEQTGKIIDTNPRAEQMLDCTRAQILGHKQSEFLALDKIDTETGLLDTSVSGLVWAEGQMVRPDGKKIPIVAHTSRLKLYDRPLVLWLCQEIPKTEKSINDEDFEHLEKLASKSN